MSAARRLSHDERMKKTWEDQVFERERGRREKEEKEERRVEKLVQDCPVKVVEVSAKDGFGASRISLSFRLASFADLVSQYLVSIGIEEVFSSIAEQLIVRKAEIEKARVLRSRNSIMLHETPAIDTAKSGWCAC